MSAGGGADSRTPMQALALPPCLPACRPLPPSSPPTAPSLPFPRTHEPQARARQLPSRDGLPLRQRQPHQHHGRGGHKQQAGREGGEGRQQH